MSYSLTHNHCYDLIINWNNNTMEHPINIWHGKEVAQSLAKDGYTGRLMTDGRLETYFGSSLVWTSYSVSEDTAESEFMETVELVSGQLYM